MTQNEKQGRKKKHQNLYLTALSIGYHSMVDSGNVIRILTSQDE